MSFIPPFPSATQILNPSLNSRTSVNHDKVDGHSANNRDCFSIEESLLMGSSEMID